MCQGFDRLAFHAHRLVVRGKLRIVHLNHFPCECCVSAVELDAEMSVLGVRVLIAELCRIASSSKASLALSHQHSRRRRAMHVLIEDAASCAHNPRCVYSTTRPLR